MAYKFGLHGSKLSEHTRNLVKSLQTSGGERVNDTSWQLLWVLNGIIPADLYQFFGQHRLVNMIPKIDSLYNKTELSESLEGYLANNPSVKRFHPITLNLATQRADIEQRVNDDPPGSWILKPKMGTRGEGIRLLQEAKDLPTGGGWLVQQYIQKPLLIRNRKTKLRVYLLLTDLDPITGWVYSNGILKIAVDEYALDYESLQNPYAHNLASQLHQNHPDYCEDMCRDDFNRWHDNFGTDNSNLWPGVDTILAHTLAASQAQGKAIKENILNGHQNCFELFGVDIMFEEDGTPWLIEINRSPSMANPFPSNINSLMQQSAVKLSMKTLLGVQTNNVDTTDIFRPLILP